MTGSSSKSRRRRSGWHLGVLWLSSALCAVVAHAEPYIAVRQGLACSQCHLNPTGGGARNMLGNAMAQTQIAARPLPEGVPTWSGEVGQWLKAGGDLRVAANGTRTTGSKARAGLSLEQARVYLAFSVLPERWMIYVDQQLGPDTSVNRESWLLYRMERQHAYVKAGRMYLPFGLRLQDQQAYTRQLVGINMDTPDNGVEFGWQRGAWEVQAAVSSGLAGGSSAGTGQQYTGQLTRVSGNWRLGLGVNRNDNGAVRSTAGALFAGLRTGPLAWLAELDQLRLPPVNTGIANAGDRQLAAALLECNWQTAPGSNLKLTGEWLDPDRRRGGDLQHRLSALYEYTPLPYLQLRAGLRRLGGGVPAVAADTQQAFVELHAYF